MARCYSTRWKQLEATSETCLSYLELACACLCPHSALCSTWGSVAPAGVMFIAQLRSSLSPLQYMGVSGPSWGHVYSSVETQVGLSSHVHCVDPEPPDHP